MDGEVGACGDGADAVMHALCDVGGGDGVDDDVGTGEVTLDRLRGGEGELLGALEGEVAGESEGDVGKVARAGAAGAEAVDGEDPGDCGEVVDEVPADLRVRGGGVCERVDGAAGEGPTDAEDDEGDDDGGDGVGEFQERDVPVLSGVGGGEADEDGGGGPDVGAEVDGIGFKGFAAVLDGYAVEGAGTGVVDDDREQED